MPYELFSERIWPNRHITFMLLQSLAERMAKDSHSHGRPGVLIPWPQRKCRHTATLEWRSWSSRTTGGRKCSTLSSDTWGSRAAENYRRRQRFQ
jgi:hypothetical protein